MSGGGGRTGDAPDAPGSGTGAGGGPGVADAEVELRVDSVAHGGDGVARDPDGRVVFLPRTAPGDRVRVHLVEDRGSFARGRVQELVEAGPGRAEPPCPFYDRCGGCQLQHLEVEAELEAKRRAVADVLERIGGRSLEIPSPVTRGPRLGYRNRISLTLRRADGSVRAGYHRWDDAARLVDVDRCPLAEEPVNRAWRGLREAWGDGAGRLPGGEELRLTLRATADGEVGLLVEGGRRDRSGEPEAVPEAVPEVGAYHWVPDRGGLRHLAGRRRLRERWQGTDLRLGPRTFLQVNRHVAGAMEAHLDGELGPELGGRRILDLYAGVGLRALRWGRRGAEVAACEVEDEAVGAGREAARAAGVAFPFRARAVEEALDDLLPADVAVVNPPRRGLSRAVAGRLAATTPAELAELAYVSCEPSTLARDLGRLGREWRVRSAQPFDAFPQTAHVETILWLERP